MVAKVFVTGATGTTGSAAIRALRASGVEVIAGVHSMEKSAPLQQIGAIVKPFNMNDVPGMLTAIRGADALFLVTPVTQDTEKLTESIVAAAKGAGVRHITKLSGLNVDSEPGFTLGRWHRAAEQVIEASGLDWTFLRPNAFMQNFLSYAESIKSQGNYYSPFAAAAISFIDARDIGEVASKVLTTDGHACKIYNLTGPRSISDAEVTQHLSTAIGKPVTCAPVALAQIRQGMIGQGMPHAVADATVELLGIMATGKAGDVSPDVERLLGRPPRDFAQFANDFASVFR
jgi:uncharacterized protein YbjT (DUF2867 family)